MPGSSYREFLRRVASAVDIPESMIDEPELEQLYRSSGGFQHRVDAGISHVRSHPRFRPIFEARV